jgi:hypothetical protein
MKGLGKVRNVELYLFKVKHGLAGNVSVQELPGNAANFCPWCFDSDFRFQTTG